jgi:hypothetical protein
MNPDGAATLEDAVAFLQRFVVFQQPEAADFLALWVAHTWAFEAAVTTPYPRITSAERSSGKSRTLEALEVLVRRPWKNTAPSAASIYRKGDDVAPTLLLDEIDNLDLGARTELLGMFNDGYRFGATVTRCTDKGEYSDYDVFHPKAFSGKDSARLPDTLHSRCVLVYLQRRRRDGTEPIEPFKHYRQNRQARPLRDQLEAWALERLDVLAVAEPDLPEALEDRVQEIWEPLLAIADLAGGNWPQRARRAALVLAGADEGDDGSWGVRLLADIRALFQASGESAIHTRDLVAELNQDEGLPYGGWNAGRGITGHDVARLLRPYRIRPKQVWLDDRNRQGYRRDVFADAWERYLPEIPALDPRTPRTPETKAFNHGELGDLDPRTPPSGTDEEWPF